MMAIGRLKVSGFLGVLAVVQMVMSGEANALTANQSPDAGPDRTLEEIVVTAQKRSEELKDVPASLSVLSTAAMETRGLEDITDFATYIPGLTLTDTFGGLGQLTLRGITAGNNQGSSLVGVYIDETPVGSSSAFAGGNVALPEIDTFDLQRVEVLRGPQGTLYGASAMGGLLKYVTTPPNLNSWEERVEIDGGNTQSAGGLYGAKGLINIPLIEGTLALRTDFFYRHTDGYVQNIVTGTSDDSKSTGGRVSLLWTPSDTTKIRFTSMFDQHRMATSDVVDLNPTTLQPLYGDLKQSRALDEPMSRQFQQHSLNIEWDLGFANLLSATSYNRFKSSNTYDFTSLFASYAQALAPSIIGAPLPGAPLVSFTTPYLTNKYTEEVRLTSLQNQRLEWQLGLFYTDERSNLPEDLNVTVPGFTVPPILGGFYVTNRPNEYKEGAAFVDGDFHFTDALDLGLGFRESHNDQRSIVYKRGPFEDSLAPSKVYVTDDSSSQSVFTYAVRPRWKINEDWTSYGAVSTGYRAGGPNTGPPAGSGIVVPPEFQADRLTNYEVGLKGLTPDKRLAVNLAIYHIDWTKIQLTAVTDNFGYYANGGSAKSDGVEFDATYSPVEGLILGANAAYTDARLTSDAPGVGGVSGNQLALSPKWSGAATADYNFHAFGAWTGSLGSSYRYVGVRQSDFPGDTSDPDITIPSYSVVDLRTGLETQEWRLNLLLNNVANKRGLTNIYAENVPYGLPAFGYYIQPRTIEARVTWLMR